MLHQEVDAKYWPGRLLGIQRVLTSTGHRMHDVAPLRVPELSNDELRANCLHLNLLALSPFERLKDLHAR